MDSIGFMKQRSLMNEGAMLASRLNEKGTDGNWSSKIYGAPHNTNKVQYIHTTMRIGNLQERWTEEEPLLFDKVTRTVNLFITECSREQPADGDSDGDSDGNEDSDKAEVVTVQGYSFFPVQIDSIIDYGHIKSQLIEAAYAQKDEFGLVMNAVAGVLEALRKGSKAEMYEALSTEDIQRFTSFVEYRNVCAQAAKAVIAAYQ